jgi:hypothetical protein
LLFFRFGLNVLTLFSFCFSIAEKKNEAIEKNGEVDTKDC